MKKLAATAIAAICLTLGAPQSRAASLQVTPVKIQVEAPAAASKVTVSSAGDQALMAQFRIFRWTRVNGQDELTQTRDVVASPPVVKLAPGQPYVVRIVRVTKTSVAGEEAYRLLVDEIPDPKSQPSAFGPRFVIRQSIPVFFTSSEAAPQIAWDAVAKGNRIHITAHNSGERRVKLTELNIVGGDDKALKLNTGLGYVLGGSTEQWSAKITGKGLKPGTTVTIMAQGDYGPIRTQAKIRAAK